MGLFTSILTKEFIIIMNTALLIIKTEISMENRKHLSLKIYKLVIFQKALPPFSFFFFFKSL